MKSWMMMSAMICTVVYMFFGVAIPELPPVDMPTFKHLESVSSAPKAPVAVAKFVEVGK